MPKQIIFGECNAKGEPLIEVAERQTEIWTACARTSLEAGDRVILKRARQGKWELEGVVKEVKRNTGGQWQLHYKLAGFETGYAWGEKYQEVNKLPKEGLPIAHFIHITDIKRRP